MWFSDICRKKKGSQESLWEGPMAYQLVGEVMAHQGYDE